MICTKDRHLKVTAYLDICSAKNVIVIISYFLKFELYQALIEICNTFLNFTKAHFNKFKIF